jgi:hypothetical protein
MVFSDEIFISYKNIYTTKSNGVFNANTKLRLHARKKNDKKTAYAHMIWNLKQQKNEEASFVFDSLS